MSLANLSNVDLNRIRIFTTIVECRGFSDAALKLGLSVASVSVHMAELEQTLGFRLCSRGRAGFALTPEGNRVYQACQALHVAHHNFTSEIGKAKGQLTGELHLGVIDNAVFDPNLNIPLMISKLNQIAPEGEISLHTLPPPELEKGVLDQRLHLAIGVFYDLKKELDYIPLCSERLTLYCGDSHNLFNSKTVSVASLENCSFVERTYAATLKRASEELAISRVAYTSSLEAALILVLSGQFIGFLPEYYAEPWVQANRICALMKESLFVDSEVFAVKNAYPVNNQLTQTLLNIFGEM